MIAIIDYGLGNLRSVSKALESLGASVEVTNNIGTLNRATSVVLPGVGAFSHGINNLKRLGLIPVIKDIISKQKPFLGICLGLQLLFSETEEHGTHEGLNIIKGKVKKFPVPSEANGLKIPHMGWNQTRISHPASYYVKTLSPLTSKDKSRISLFNNIPNDSYFYFVHSYYVEPEDKNVIAATTDYGIEFCSAIAKNNIFGVQFHPEKSSELGLQILKNFISLV